MPTSHGAHPVDDMFVRWKAAFDGHLLDDLTGLFTPDAIFQGWGPETVRGRDAVRAYYAAVPEGRTAQFTVRHTFMIGSTVAGGFADVDFGGPDGWHGPAHISLVLQLEEGSWRIRQHHSSKIAPAH